MAIQSPAISQDKMSQDKTPPSPDTSAYKILMSANEVYRRNPVLPIPLGDIAARAGFSRSLIYSHFPDQISLIHGLITHHINLLTPKLEMAIQLGGKFEGIAIALGDLLMSHYLKHGMLLALVSQDEFISRDLPDDYVRFSRKNMLIISRKLRGEFGFTARQSLAIMILLSVIPEQSARLVHNNLISRETGFSSMRSAIKVSTKTFARTEGM